MAKSCPYIVCRNSITAIYSSQNCRVKFWRRYWNKREPCSLEIILSSNCLQFRHLTRRIHRRIIHVDEQFQGFASLGNNRGYSYQEKENHGAHGETVQRESDNPLDCRHTFYFFLPVSPVFPVVSREFLFLEVYNSSTARSGIAYLPCSASFRKYNARISESDCAPITCLSFSHRDKVSGGSRNKTTHSFACKPRCLRKKRASLPDNGIFCNAMARPIAACNSLMRGRRGDFALVE